MPSEKSLQNLKPFRTKEEAAAAGRKGRETKSRKKQEAKSVREILKIYVKGKATAAEREKAEELGILGVYNKGLLIAVTVIKKALAGDLKACEMLLNYCGEDKKENAIIKKIVAETDLITAQKKALEKQKQDGEALGAVNVNINIVDAAEKKDDGN